MEKDGKIYVAGHSGLFGSETMRQLMAGGYQNLCCVSHAALDLTRQAETEDFFAQEKPDYVFVMCGKVGGIQANRDEMAEFTMENLKMNANIIESAHRFGVKKLLYLGSSCMYPRECAQPIREDYLLTGALEPTNEGYALAKLIGLRACAYYKKQYGDNFISCIPSNVYGPGDNFDEKSNHVIPALLKRFHAAREAGAKTVSIWGSGRARREFLYIGDAVSACIRLMENYDGMEPVNVGTGVSTSIRELAETVRRVTGYEGALFFDTEKPDGMPLRQLDNSRIFSLGWRPETPLEDGLRQTWQWYLTHKEALA